MSIDIKEFYPHEKLVDYVELYWHGDFNVKSQSFIQHKVVPNGSVELIFHLTEQHCKLISNNQWVSSPDYTIIGLYTMPYIVSFNSNVKVFSIRLKPEGVYSIFGVPAAEFGNGYEDMECVLGRGFREFALNLRGKKTIAEMKSYTNEFLLMKLYETSLNSSYVNNAAQLIRQMDGFLSIDELADKVNISKRQLEREFKNKLGVTPKMLMRLTRLNKVHRMLNAGYDQAYTNLAYDTGYADQAHFIREFKTFTGEKPTLFTKRREEFIVNP